MCIRRHERDQPEIEIVKWNGAVTQQIIGPRLQWQRGREKIVSTRLDDTDPGVRIEALHALACDRCKTSDCRPDAIAVLDRAIRLLLHDPDRHVRAWACELVGRWVHDHDKAISALITARDTDPSPAVRKKAGWYTPGGTIFNKTRTRPRSHRTPLNTT